MKIGTIGAGVIGKNHVDYYLPILKMITQIGALLGFHLAISHFRLVEISMDFPSTVIFK